MPLKIMRMLYAPAGINFDFIGANRKELDFFNAWAPDITICSRPGDEKINEYFRWCKNQGCRVVVDLDDDILNFPEHHAFSGEFKKRAKNIEEALGLADILWYSTDKFLETYGPGVVLPNAILPGDLPENPSPDNGFWGWRGLHIQSYDWDAFKGQYEGNKKNAGLRDIAKHWFFMGWFPPAQHRSVTALPPIQNPQDYLKKIKEMGLNYIWKPMINHRFSEHKSNISLLEAAMAGGVCMTNFAGRPGFEYATDRPLSYDNACELWVKAKEDILNRYNLVKVSQARAESLIKLVQHLMPAK